MPGGSSAGCLAQEIGDITLAVLISGGYREQAGLVGLSVTPRLSPRTIGRLYSFQGKHLDYRFGRGCPPSGPAGSAVPLANEYRHLPGSRQAQMVVACTAPKPVAWRVNLGGLRILLYFLLGWIVLFVAVAVVASD